MALGDMIARLRQSSGLSQSELAERLYVTRQAISRWENGETTPGIDMCKLIAVTLDVPISSLLEMPEIGESALIPTAEGDGDSEALIEGCAPLLSRYAGTTLDEAVSFMGAMLPALERWRAVSANEREYGAEARERYGDEAVDAANERLLAMDEREWKGLGELELAIIEQLKAAMATGDAAGVAACELASMHAKWISMQWGEGAYNEQAHRGLAQGYLKDPRFVAYYDERAGEGATRFLTNAILANIG
ncbi:MAG: TipAS antibiotic-recognition domain-containing protein [bacterium]|nr:TipAS antibiotic-recognition domain-containing protein [bacterium]